MFKGKEELMKPSHTDIKWVKLEPHNQLPTLLSHWSAAATPQHPPLLADWLAAATPQHPQ